MDVNRQVPLWISNLLRRIHRIWWLYARFSLSIDTLGLRWIVQVRPVAFEIDAEVRFRWAAGIGRRTIDVMWFRTGVDAALGNRRQWEVRRV